MVSKYYNILINMTVVQLSYFNVHIGHLKKIVVFLHIDFFYVEEIIFLLLIY